MDTNLQNIMRNIPAMDKLLSLPEIKEYEKSLGHETVKSIIFEMLQELRTSIKNGNVISVDQRSIESKVKSLLNIKYKHTLRPVVNATGVVLHTNLGRSPLANEASQAAAKIAARYSTLEYSSEEGVRGNRNDHVEWLIRQLTGAEAAVVVNNNAGAVILALSALAKNRETIISRGELVEIGGSFRIPDIMSFSNTIIVEVGTTNCTHIYDFENAITENTSLILKVHPSNFRISGFNASVSREELAATAHKHNLIYMEDLGSGLFVKLNAIPPLECDPTVSEVLKSGCDVVTFSGDKLLGGPQAGIIAGKKTIIDAIKRTQLLRALRVDKVTLAALEATLRIYMRKDYKSIPVIRMIEKTSDELFHDADSLLSKLQQKIKKTNFRSINFKIEKEMDTIGGGALPQIMINGYSVTMEIPKSLNAAKLAKRLRNNDVPVIASVTDNKISFHIRTLQEGDDDIIVDAICNILSIK